MSGPRPSVATRPLHVSREFCGFLAPRYQSLVASYAEAKRERFLGELAQLEEEVHLARTHAQDKLERYALQHADRHGLQHAVGAGGCPCSRVVGTMLAGLVDDRLAWERHFLEEQLSRAPRILVPLRSHTIWEQMSVKLCFTVQGFPTPVVQWYKDGSLICQAEEPGKYRIESKYGVHTLEINRADFDDTATYSAVATNVHGQASTNAAVVVRRFRGDEEPFYSVGLPISLPLSSVIPYTHFDVQFLEKFGVTFRTEGETLALKCTLLVTPELKRVQPQAQWYRDDVLLKESQWTKMFFGGGQASLSFSHLNKDDEGLYTLRIVSRGGVHDHSAFLFVRDADPLVTGAPGAPMDLQCHDVNRDYVIVTWKPPNTTKESPVIGYFIDRCEVGTDSWVQCNDRPVKICKYPVTGLFEGKSYIFRVRAVNNVGISRPSRVSEAVAALDPLDLKPLQAVHWEGDKEIVIYQEDLEGIPQMQPWRSSPLQAVFTQPTPVLSLGSDLRSLSLSSQPRPALAGEVQLPGPPTNVHASEISRAYVVLSWDPPAPRGKEPLMYFIEKSVVGSGSWQRVNAQMAVRSPRYTVFDLAEGKPYVFRVLSANKHGLSDPSEITAPIQAQDTIGRDLETDTARNLLGAPLPCTVFLVQISSKAPNSADKRACGSLACPQTPVPLSLCPCPPCTVVPSAPGRVVASRNTRTSVVVQWDPPKHKEDLLGYYVDCCVAGSTVWEPCNHKPIGYNRCCLPGSPPPPLLGPTSSPPRKREKHTPRDPRGLRVQEEKGLNLVVTPPIRVFVRFVVHGLTTGEQYIFRVKAVNAVGTSENSQESDVIEVQATLTVPSHPYGINLLNCDGHSMTLGWKMPKFRGDSPILGYYVDKREAHHQNWHEVNVSPVQERILTVEGLAEGSLYEFRITATNLVGIGPPSDPSELFKCEAWTAPEPGPAYDLMFCEVRDTSLVLLWKAPVYSGSSPVSGYFVDYKEEDSGEWITFNEAPTAHRYLKVCNLHQGKTYIFRVRAVNESGVGKPSDTSEMVLAEARPGTKEISVGVDEKGDIYLSFDCQEMADTSRFTWCKSYEDIAGDERFKIETVGDHSKLYFKNLDKVDLGTYSVSVSDTDGVSSSFVLDEEELKRLVALSNEIKNPTIPLKSELAYGISDKGQVRFWLQAEHLSPDASYRFIVNDGEVTDSEPPRTTGASGEGTVSSSPNQEASCNRYPQMGVRCNSLIEVIGDDSLISPHSPTFLGQLIAQAGKPLRKSQLGSSERKQECLQERSPAKVVMLLFILGVA
ncbi:hypothetical protein J1605_016161 [Eschrichtius robustus]|uniref:Myomesin-2 n=1 Tax=Eschrichtius robustus TaxID=9764 RepID=A0AB34G978_ESCRO|nr:hypothetical protein J1605_016161 [Eschrichtius robustus]